MPSDSFLPIDSRAFTQDDVLTFAQLSGDYNPLHVDPLIARRTHFGTCVVHGIFLLLWSMDCSFRKHHIRSSPHQIHVRFLRPLLVGSTATLLTQFEASTLILRLQDQQKILMETRISLHPASHELLSPSIDPLQSPQKEPPQTFIPGQSPINDKISLFWKSDIASTLFPYLHKHIDHHTLAILTASTRIVGMKIPGEHSIYLEGNFIFPQLDNTTADTPILKYELVEHRKSTQRFCISINHPRGHGQLWALARPAPVKQPPLSQIAQHVPQDRFLNKKVLIIGGSRGLGELAAKILAAGGAHVCITYRSGYADAQAVVSEITHHGKHSTLQAFDIQNPQAIHSLIPLAQDFHHIAYFATPPILDSDGKQISEPLLQNYLQVYVLRFIDLIQAWTTKAPSLPSIFYASTVFAQTPPLRLPEYAISKAAGEAACRWLQIAHPKMKIHIARFPRLLTDQTVSFLSAGTHDNFETLYNELQLWIPQ